MSTLSSLLFRASVPVLGDVPEVSVASIVSDSRRAAPGALFCAVGGTRVDGNAYADQALESGCVAVLTDRPDQANRPLRVLVPSVSDALGPVCRAFHGEPDRGMKVFAVTGTNGKTSSVFLAEAMFREAGLAPILSSTVAVRYPGHEAPAAMTTPDTLELWDLVRRGRDAGARSLALEVSSHALAQGRVGGFLADAAVFTNLTRDHLDYHGTMEEYFAAKSLLFTRHLREGGVAVVNADDAHGRILLHQLGSSAVGFSIDPASGAAWILEDLHCDLDGNRFRLRAGERVLELESPLVGDVFARNLAGVALAALAMGLPEEAVRAAAREVSVPGRCQLVRAGTLRGVVDYAHTPDALERLLAGLRPMVKGRLVAVFGCGGDRDRGKRPLMGGIASRLADLAVLTSDNPRTEDPERILDEVQAGIGAGSAVRIADRREAIARAVEGLGPDDLVVVAGKGHEDYQIVGTEKRHFDDREVLAEQLALRDGRSGT